MTRTPLPELAGIAKPVIGMLHLPALPGAPRNSLTLAEIQAFVRGDADALLAGGVHALLLENFGDTPFYPGTVPASVVAQMTQVAGEVRRQFDVPLGINVLRNDGLSALAVAHAAGAAFIRVNILCGARVTDQGLIQGNAHELLRERARLQTAHTRIFADIDVKHSAPLGAPRALEDEIADTVQRGGADAIIISGAGTGQEVDVGHLRRAKAATDHPIIVGSGVAPENVRELALHADAFIVGTSLKVDGRASNPVDPARVRALLARLE